MENRNPMISSLLSARISGMLLEAERLRTVPHALLQGRFKELLITKLIEPLLPPTCKVLHGTVIDVRGRRLEARKTEDDILIVDTECLPPILYSSSDAILPLESVLARIEVKSTLSRRTLRDAIEGAREFRDPPLIIRGWGDSADAKAIQAVFAFSSDLVNPRPDSEYRRLKAVFREMPSENGPPIDCLCVAGRGLWTYKRERDGGTRLWMKCRADTQNSEILSFLAQILDVLPQLRHIREGASIGNYVLCLEERLVPAEP